jgi:uncharacterized protein
MFWDSSAVVPIVLPEARSAELTSILAADPEPAVWWSTLVECHSACYRRHRRAPIPDTVLRDALQRLNAFCEDADQVSAGDQVRRRAVRLLATHDLRAADSLQLAAALIWCEENPHGEPFISLDDRLRAAARAEGFDVRP